MAFAASALLVAMLAIALLETASSDAWRVERPVGDTFAATMFDE